MLSRKCQERNNGIIPMLLEQHQSTLLDQSGWIDMGTAENFLMSCEVLSCIQQTRPFDALTQKHLAYGTGIGGSLTIRTLLADQLNRYWAPLRQVRPDHLVLGAGASYVLNALVEQVCDTGDGIMIATPYWSGLDLCISVYNDATVVPVDIPHKYYFTTACLAYYREALLESKISVKALLVCNPHNPYGQCFSREALEGLLELCKEFNLHYISDEVYGLSRHATVEPMGSKFTSVLSLERGTSRKHVLYSLSKDFAMGGIRLGALITQQSDDVRLGTALSTHSQTSSLSIILASTVLAPDAIEPFIALNAKRLYEAFCHVKVFLEQRNIAFIQPTHGMFVFARLCPEGDARAEAMLREHFKKNCVTLSSGSSYHMPTTGWFRMTFALPEPDLLEGLDRVGKSLDAIGP